MHSRKISRLPSFCDTSDFFLPRSGLRRTLGWIGDTIGNVFERETTMKSSNESWEPWAHPLIRTLDQPFNRRMLIAGAFGVVAAPSLRLVSAQETPVAPMTDATPETALEGETDAVALLESAVEAIAALETFGFELVTTRGSSTIFQGLELKSVEGVVRRPLDIEATVTVGLPIGEMSATAVGLDGEFWVQDPLTGSEWISLGSDPQIQALINPDQLLLYAVRLVKDAQITGKETINGEETTMVEGTVDFYSMIESAAGMAGESDMVGQLLVEGPKDVTFWIDGENRVVEGEIRGPIFTTESDDVVKVLSLFDFNEPVEIEAPTGV
jgi:hypothetical protein